ncbi:MAG: sigD1, partial [Clostridia bacterium]|jgi:RNA polymerase sigma factor for flagellar operon FliA|nr:sigD1 [Clostridia bacterium]
MNYEKPEVKTVNNEIWEKYAQTHSIELRNFILTEYLYIVSCNIKRMQSIYINDDIEDLTNQGVLALIKCIDKFDYTRGIQFDSYASIRVRGSIIDYIREKDWVPISVRKRTRAFQNSYEELQNEYNRAPTDDELAKYLDISVKELNKVRSELHSTTILFYEEMLQENDTGIQENWEGQSHPSPDQEFIADEFKKYLTATIEDLDEKERTVISLYYFEELKLKDISYVMGLSESRISQLHAKALLKLRVNMNSYLYS